MEVYDFPQYNNLSVCGDIHGEFATLVYNLNRFEIVDSVIIVAGDCGIGFEKVAHYSQLYNKLRKKLEKSNNVLLLVRGNHDDPTFFNGTKIDFERMKCIPDYSIVKVAGHNVLCIGGAVSVDRAIRQQAMWLDNVKGRDVRPLYWENEPAVLDDKALSEACKIGIDTVVTHTCPSFCYPTSKIGVACFVANDEKLSEELTTERALMDKIYERLIAEKQPLQSWYYAHFHQSNTEFINNVKFCLLNINEIKELQ